MVGVEEKGSLGGGGGGLIINGVYVSWRGKRLKIFCMRAGKYGIKMEIG